MSISFRNYSLVYFEDLMKLMCCEQVSKDCRCLSHRVEPQDLELDTLAANKMQTMTGQRKVHGILAFKGDKCIGWAGVEPMPMLVGHDVYEDLLGGEVDYQMQDDHWGIHCMFVHPEHRGQGLIKELVSEAVKYSEHRGATKIIAFGAPADIYKELPINQKFSGSEKHFQNLGFQKLVQMGRTYTIMVREVQDSKPRLSLA